VCRAIAISTGKPYEEVYQDLWLKIRDQLGTGHDGRSGTSPRSGLHQFTYGPYLEGLGYRWVEFDRDGLDPTEMPQGHVIAHQTGHLAAIIDGVIHDTRDPKQVGNDRVIGYWIPTDSLALTTTTAEPDAKPDRNKIRKRIAALLARTVENGASEAEAMIAAQKAARLMTEHSLSYSSTAEIEAEEYADDSRQWFKGSKGRSRAAPIPVTRRCIVWISELCGVEHLWNSYTGMLTFFGPAHDTATAHALEQIIRGAIAREWRDYRKTAKSTSGSARASFQHAMSHRVAQRLAGMIEQQREQERQSETGSELIVVRNALLVKRFEAAHPDVRASSKPSSTFHDGAAFDAGRAAGGRLELGEGVSRARGTLAIPHAS